MKILVDKKDVTKGILLAETEEEYRVLKYLMNITWGFYYLKNCMVQGMSRETDPLIIALQEKYPNVTGIGKLQSPQGFVEEEVMEEENNRRKAMKEQMDKEEKAKELFSHLLNKE